MAIWLLCQQHKSMQQIAILIIAILSYVQGIRYDGGSSNNNNNNNNENYMLKEEQLINNSNNFQPLYNAPLSFQQQPQQQQANYEQIQFYGVETTTTTPIPIETTNNGNNYINVLDDMHSRSSSSIGGMARQSFRPSQVIDFTLNDATIQQHHQQQQQQQERQQQNFYAYTSADNIMLKQQLKFPTNLQQQQQREIEQFDTTSSDSAYYLNNNNNNNNNNNHNNIETLDTSLRGGVRKMIPFQLQSTPILSYKDPYTNENYQFTTTSGNNVISHEPPSSVQLNLIQQYQPEQQPEEYVVGSSYYVGNDNNHAPNRDSVDFIYQKQIKEQQQLQSNKHNHQNNYRPQQPTYSSGGPSLQVLPSTPHTVVGERLSYDSHDYPPPSYAQSQTDYGGVVFSDGAIQQPSKKFSSKPQAPASISNYANNFVNYLENGEQQDYTISTYENTPGYGSPPPQIQSSMSSSSLRPPSSYGSFNHYNNYYHDNDNNYNKYTFTPQGTFPITYQQQQLQLQKQQQQKQQEYYRPPQYGHGPPPRPVIPAPPPAHGFPSSLASFFSTTQEYAPQFTNLLLNGIGGGGAAAASDQSPSKSPQIRPLRNMQLIKALENIARNDDLQCVPKVLCQMIASQTQRGQLPAFITSPTITNFLSGFPVTSPMLIYGRAALLGLSGGDNGCTRSYLKCPKNEYEILYYLNNHRGGFFKFFSEPDDAAILQQQQQQHDNNQNIIGGGAGGGESSLLSIFSAITGIDAFTPIPTTTTTTPRPPPPPPPPPPPRPATASLDSVGNFFTKVLSEYLNGVEYQRRRRKRSPIANENTVKDIKAEIKENNIKAEINFNSAQETEEQEDEKLKSEHNTQSRILHKTLRAQDEQTFFPQDKPQDYQSVEHVKLYKNHANRYGRLLKAKRHGQKNAKKISEIVKKFNANRAQRKLKFPVEGAEQKEMTKSEPADVEYESEGDEQEGDDMNNEKQVVFLDDYESEGETIAQQNHNGAYVNFLQDDVGRVPNEQNIIFNDNTNNYNYNNADQQPHDTQINAYKLKEREHRNFVFPDQQYDQYHIRKGRILNRPTYASQYNEYKNEFVIPGHKRQPHADRAIFNTNENSLHINQMSNSAYQNFHFSNTQNTVQSNSNFYANKNNYAETPTRFMTNPTTTNKYYSSNGNNNFNYNRYGQQQSTPQLTTKPSTRHKDDQNIYVTNARGETEYYLTPGGRKVYLRNN